MSEWIEENGTNIEIGYRTMEALGEVKPVTKPQDTQQNRSRH